MIVNTHMLTICHLWCIPLSTAPLQLLLFPLDLSIWLHSLLLDGSAPLKDCAVNATGYTNCVTAQNATGTFTMISNDAATSLFMVRNPPLADGESVDL